MDYLSLSIIPFLPKSLTEDDDSCLDNVYLSEVDRYIFWIGGGLTFLTTFFLIIGSFRFRALQKQPGDLIIGIAASDLILSVHWITLASFPKQVDDPHFCKVVGVFGTFAGMNEFLYNVAFSVFLIFSLRNALKQVKLPKNRLHILTLGFSTLYLINMLAKDDIGKTLSGTCSIKSKCKLSFYNYFGPAIAIAYSCLGLFTYLYIKKNSPKCSRANVNRTQFLMYYLRYNIACTIIYCVIALCNVLVTILSNPEDFSKGNYKWINSLYNVAKLSSPLILSAIRFHDPMIRKYWLETFFFWRSSSSAPVDDELRRSLHESDNEESGEMNRSQQRSKNKEQNFLFNEMSSDRRTELTYTVVACVLYANRNTTNSTIRKDITEQTLETKAKDPYQHQKVFLIEEDSIKNDLPRVKDELEKRRLGILPGTLKIYCPEVFGSFVDQDRAFLDIVESLDFESNREQLLSASDPKGGKSGEFFFFSSDKKLILKTVPDVEMKMMISILERYEQHMTKNPNSLIAKVYGVYTYANTDLGLKFNLVLLKNICGFPSKFVERAYDMKGSRYDREVVKMQDVTDKSMLKGLVMKDLDFERFEKKLNLNENVSSLFLDQIERDSIFFRDVNLIDYSFMVFVVNKGQAYQEMDPKQDFTTHNKLASMKNENEEGIYYNVGIIDYLQPFNFQKSVERCMKRLQKLNPNLDTSSQDPHYYSNRFIMFIRKIVGDVPRTSMIEEIALE